MTIIGSCSICGGSVYVPDVWMGSVLPEPTCMSCGAVRSRNVIPMEPVKVMPSFQQGLSDYQRKLQQGDQFNNKKGR